MRYTQEATNNKYKRGFLRNVRQKVKNVKKRVHRYAYDIAAHKIGRGLLIKLLNHSKVNQTDKTKLLKSYNTYLSAMNNTNANNARRKAEIAASNFTNTMFRLYEKTTIKNTPVSLGTKNGVIKKVAYWAPGVIGREGLRLIGLKF